MRDQTEQELQGPIGEVKRERKQMEVLKGVKTLPGTGSLEQVHPEVRWARAAAEGRRRRGGSGGEAAGKGWRGYGLA